MSKVLVINGSPHKIGCTAAALEEVMKTLNQEGIETEMLQVGCTVTASVTIHRTGTHHS